MQRGYFVAAKGKGKGEGKGKGVSFLSFTGEGFQLCVTFPGFPPRATNHARGEGKGPGGVDGPERMGGAC